MTVLERDSFLDPNPGAIALKIQDRVREGWSVDEERPMTLYGYMWEVNFVRDPKDAKDAPPKKSRAEILADARAAKAEKAKATEGEGEAERE